MVFQRKSRRRTNRTKKDANAGMRIMAPKQKKKTIKRLLSPGDRVALKDFAGGAVGGLTGARIGFALGGPVGGLLGLQTGMLLGLGKRGRKLALKAWKEDYEERERM